jgi:glucan phosphoethanolaminetransferase (alkaline phosphatase superfamily)
MKIDFQTKTEKNNFLGLLLVANFVFATLLFILLLLQFFYAPKYYAITWTFMILLSLAIAYFNLRYFRSQYKLKPLWSWLKNHQ